ncbi:hypothetical protein [Candidatus Avelusimicrobium caledoniensis]|uniref:hypothetical protein n=1 Tax=Candidatus Avelusimicrobium caledoniensis TaxID=3416220 RepID=UPI003D108EAA
MNIFKFLNEKGKVAFSALQIGGVAAVVGVAGVAAFQFLGTPEEDNTAFNPSQYNSGEVVYVSGANTGGYQSGSYSGNGAESGPLSRISAKSINRMDRQAQLERAQAEMEEEYTQMQATAQESTAPQTPAGYQMGDSEGGLGLLSNAADAEALKNNSMGALSQSMGNIQGMIANAQAQAQAAAEGKDGAKAAGLASAKADWGSKAGGSNGGSNGVNMSFSVQNSGKNAPKGGSGGAAMGGPNVDMSNIQAQAAQMLEGARIKGKSSFGESSGMNGYKNASVGKGRGLDKGGTDLEFARKTSVEVAKSKTRSANEGAKAFLASATLSGGLMITSENFETGSGQGSKDFENEHQVNLRGIKTWAEGVDLTELDRENDRNNLTTWLWVAIAGGVAAMIAIPILKNIPVYGWIAALAAAAVGLAFCIVALVKAIEYAQKWGGEGLSTATGIIAIAMMAGIAASWIFADAFLKFYESVWQFLGFGSEGAGGGGGAAAGAAAPTSSGGSGMGAVFQEQAKLGEILGGNILPK